MSPSNAPAEGGRAENRQPDTFRLTVRGLFVLTALAAAVAYGLTQPEDSDQRAERLARRWRPTEADLKTPPAEFLDDSIVVEGDWVSGGAFMNETFRFSSTGPSTFIAEFYTSGCLDRWSIARLATRSNATVLLDQPVMSYGDVCFDRAYLVTYQGAEFLLPANRVPDFENALRFFKDASWVAHFAFMRESERERILAAELAQLEASADARDEVVDESP